MCPLFTQRECIRAGLPSTRALHDDPPATSSLGAALLRTISAAARPRGVFVWCAVRVGAGQVGAIPRHNILSASCGVCAWCDSKQYGSIHFHMSHQLCACGETHDMRSRRAARLWLTHIAQSPLRCQHMHARVFTIVFVIAYPCTHYIAASTPECAVVRPVRQTDSEEHPMVAECPMHTNNKPNTKN